MAAWTLRSGAWRDPDPVLLEQAREHVLAPEEARMPSAFGREVDDLPSLTDAFSITHDPEVRIALDDDLLANRSPAVVDPARR